MNLTSAVVSVGIPWRLSQELGVEVQLSEGEGFWQWRRNSHHAEAGSLA